MPIVFQDRAAAASDRKQSDPTVQGYSIEQALELYNLVSFRYKESILPILSYIFALNLTVNSFQ